MKSEIIAIVMENRNSKAPHVQETLTKHGCIIKARLGLHEIEGCSKQGLIILVTHGQENEINQLRDELLAHKGVRVHSMEISL